MTDNRPLVVAADAVVREHIARIAAAVGCEPRYVEDLHGARPHWAEAPLVLIGHGGVVGTERPGNEGSVAGAAVGPVSGVARRSGVLLVCSHPPTQAQWRSAVGLGVDAVACLPAEEDVVVSALADVTDRPSPRRGRVLAVVPGRGGAGASVLAAALGVIAARSGEHALLLDCDPLGGGADLLLGAESDGGLRWPELRVSSGRVSMAELTAALPTRRYGAGRLSVLSCDRDGVGPTGSAVTAVIEAGSRAGRLVVCDVPRHFDPAAAEVVRRADLVVLVVPAEVRGCVASARLRTRLAERGARVGVFVRDGGGSGLSTADVADAVGAPVLGRACDERRLARALDHGTFAVRTRSRLGRAARDVLATLGESGPAGR